MCQKEEIQTNLICAKWFPYNKGGGYRRWYGNQEYVINWEKNGLEVKSYKGSVIRNENCYFKEGITWSLISLNFTARYTPSGFLFDVGGSSGFPKDKILEYSLALLNSTVSSYLLYALNFTLNVQVGDIKRILYIEPSEQWYNKIVLITKENIEIAKTDWNSRESSWDFKQSPIINNSSSLAKSHTMWEDKVSSDFFQLHENEEELNRIFIEIYGLQDELTPFVALKDITILQEEIDRNELKINSEQILAGKTRLPLKRDVVIKQLLSYAVGCYMGRYRLDNPLLNISHPDPTEDELSKYNYNNNKFEIDDDGIIPTMGSESPFSDDIALRLKEFLHVVWGEETLTENLNYINDCLDGDMEKYLTTKFWTDHTKTYNKKPIYWQFASPNGAFKVITYMHRMNRFTTQKIRQKYLFKYINWLERKIGRLAENESSLTAKEIKRLDRLRQNLIECREYDLLLKDVADRQIGFDLDDGVTENYKLFSGVVTKI